MNITDIFQIPLFRNFTQKMQEDFLENLEYTLENHPKGKTIIHQGSPCQAIHAPFCAAMKMMSYSSPDFSLTYAGKGIILCLN